LLQKWYYILCLGSVALERIYVGKKPTYLKWLLKTGIVVKISRIKTFNTVTIARGKNQTFVPLCSKEFELIL